MSPREFSDALCFAMGLPDAQIVGFKDITGKINFFHYYRVNYYAVLSMQIS